MNILQHKTILFFYCFISAFFFPVNAVFVLSCFSAIIVSCLSYFFNSKKYTTVVVLIYGIAGLFFPPCIYFFPLVLYDVFYTEAWIAFIPVAAALVNHSRLLTIPYICLLLCGILFSWLLQKSARDYNRLEQVYKKTRDDSTELNLLLKEKNQSLLEKQDYEIYTATLKERNRIAREIHDNVGHMLSRSILMIGALKAVHKEDSMKEPLDNLESTLSQAMTSVRQSVHDLHDDSVNLKESVESLVKDFTFCHVSFQYDMGYILPREVKYSLITMIKEALVNVSRHSNASSVKIILREHPGFWQLLIEDNGTTAGTISTSGIGLENMKERISALNGRIEITKNPGFRIFATIPKQERD